MKTIQLTDLEAQVFADLMEQASQEFSNHGCNDYPIVVTAANVKDVVDLIDKVIEDEDEKAEMTAKAVPGKKLYFQDWMFFDALGQSLSEAS